MALGFAQSSATRRTAQRGEGPLPGSDGHGAGRRVPMAISGAAAEGDEASVFDGAPGVFAADLATCRLPSKDEAFGGFFAEGGSSGSAKLATGGRDAADSTVREAGAGRPIKRPAAIYTTIPTTATIAAPKATATDQRSAGRIPYGPFDSKKAVAATASEPDLRSLSNARSRSLR